MNNPDDAITKLLYERNRNVARIEQLTRSMKDGWEAASGLWQKYLDLVLDHNETVQQLNALEYHHGELQTHAEKLWIAFHTGDLSEPEIAAMAEFFGLPESFQAEGHDNERDEVEALVDYQMRNKPF